MRRSTLLTAVAAGVAASMFLSVAGSRAWAHCEVPCGIYDDHARVAQMLEDTGTITKATDQINGVAGQHGAQAVNQATRWVATKEEHATRIQHTIAQYFLTQRVKPVQPGAAGWEDYVTRLAEHHAVMVAAMKTKQSVDPSAVKTLRSAIEKIGVNYPRHEH
jgi:nickel superoxide dismutase